MPGFDYSRFDKLDASDSEDEATTRTRDGAGADVRETDAILADLPLELSPELSLVLAARHGQANVVEALLGRGAPVDSRDPHGGSALLRAVEGGIANRAVVELLLRRRASVEARADDGETPLTRAAAAGPSELLAALLDAGGPHAEARGEALAAAAIAGNRSTTAQLLASQALACIQHACRLPLNVWAEHGCEDILEDLLLLRAEVSARDVRGTTPLSCAVKSGHASIVRWLCERGADVDAPAANGRAPLVAAAEALRDEARAEEVVTSLLEHRASLEPPAGIIDTGTPAPTPLVAAAGAGRLGVARLLLAARAAPSGADHAGRRPLPAAAVAGATEIARMLLEAGASPDDRGLSGAAGAAAAHDAVGGVTALSVAAATGDLALATLLLEARADCNVEDQRGMLPLMAAARGRSLALCERLLAARAAVDARQADSGKTALVFAASAGAVEVCTALVQARADVDALAETGARPLHAAAANGHEAVCRALLAAGADASAPGPGGQDAASLAASGGHADVGQLLAAARGDAGGGGSAAGGAEAGAEGAAIAA